ncbi:MAG: hypothetical protein HFF90_05905 [Oscillibacter sp.]|nr:hypothetical protein [Oscillibacter sp.]
MENVLVIPTAVLDAALPQGSLIVQDIPAVLSLIQAHKSWLPRPQAEQDLAYRPSPTPSSATAAASS